MCFRNKWKIGLLIITVIQCVIVRETIAQISPGDLASVHADLEGISNCTQCHILGEKVSNDLCLACHDDIKSLINQDRGFHASSDVSTKDCFACHSDHHGRKFDMIRFDEDAFDHNKAGYKLEGSHNNIKCNDCHKSDNIADPEIRRRNTTFLGLETDCISCHDDIHQNTLSNRCLDCHSMNQFKPADLFEHALTEFPLKGEHQNVDCASCHEVTTRNGKEFQEFEGIAFQNCNTCHEDVHNGRLGTGCAQCHYEFSFAEFIENPSFDHNLTSFQLRERHDEINCASCHDVNAGVDNVFKDFAHIEHVNCMNCHDDVHENKFGSDCASCHNERLFQDVSDLVNFNHALTSFPIEGAHIEVDCRECHSTKLTDPLPHNRCADCHADFHEGQFSRNGVVDRDCLDCHNVNGFNESSYSIDQHNTSTFPLLGAHLATPCFACHMKDEEWKFKEIGEQCVDCHNDVHSGDLAEKYYPNRDCMHCHSPTSWRSVVFDHSATGYDLIGSHKTANCTACHLSDPMTNEISGHAFAGLSSTCASCHDDAHHKQFEVEGETDCMRCHDSKLWKPSTFNHNDSRFPLDGAHKEVACAKCHSTVEDEGEAYVLFRPIEVECVSCHN